MPQVVLTASACRKYTGETQIELPETDLRALLRALDARFPGFEAFIDRSMAISIDGEIFQNAWTHELRPDSEIYLIPKIAAG